jgi:pimeloyl-ACP methyl ester carboxylesterase
LTLLPITGTHVFFRDLSSRCENTHCFRLRLLYSRAGYVLQRVFIENGGAMDLRKSIGKKLTQAFFAQCITNRLLEQVPEWNVARPINFRSRDGLGLHGWAHVPTDHPRGTVFFCHGYTLHSHHTVYLHYAKYLTRKFNLATLGFDFRHHGLSDDAPVTFGSAESLDVRAAMDYADEHGFPKPYILFGDSLGALAAQRTTVDDERVHAAIIKSCPSSPWEAIQTAFSGVDVTPMLAYLSRRYRLPQFNVRKLDFTWLLPLVALINDVYERDVLNDGDIKRHTANPSHAPRLLYVMGDQDHYGWERSKTRYDHWYAGEPATFNVWPAEAPHEKKWFVLAEGKAHTFGGWDWDGFYPLLDQFFRIVLPPKS